MPRKSRLTALTSLRFFAAFYVVFFHSVRPWLGVSLSTGSRFLRNIALTGYVSVGFFFVLSGFILAYTYGSPNELTLVPRKFWRARFARIYPVFALSLIIGAAPAFFQLHRMYPSVQANAKFIVYGIANFLMVSFLVPNADATILNSPGWSLSDEAVFYLFFPWIAAKIWRVKGRNLSWVMVGACLVAVVIPFFALCWDPALVDWKASFQTSLNDSRLAYFVNYHPFARLPDFILGAALGRFFLERSQPKNEDGNRFPKHGLKAAFGCFLILLVLGQSDRIPYLFLHNGLLDFLFAYVIYQFAMDTGRVSSALSVPWLVFLGEASYSLYILHVPIQEVYLAILNRSHLGGVLSLGDFFLVYVCMILVVSSIVFKYFEEPMRQRLR